MPSCCRKLRPMLAVTCDEVAEYPQHLVEHRDRVTGDVGAGHLRQRGVPRRPIAAGPRPAGRARRRRVPAVTGGRRRPLAGFRSARGCRPSAGRRRVWIGPHSRSSASRVTSHAARRTCAGRRSAPPTAASWLDLRVGDGLVGLLLGQPRGRLLVHLLGAGPLQVVHHRLGTGGQGLAGGRGGDDVVGTGRASGSCPTDR